MLPQPWVACDGSFLLPCLSLTDFGLASLDYSATPSKKKKQTSWKLAINVEL